MKSARDQLNKDCSFNKWLQEQINANNTDCVEVVACVNDQLALTDAGTLTNFNTRVIQAIIDYFNQTGVQAPTAAEVCAYLNSLTAGTITNATKLVFGDCSYGTVADLIAFLSTEIALDDQTLSSSGNTMSLTNGGTAPIINSNTLVNDGVNTLTSTVNGVSDSDVIINSVASSTDVNGDLIITVNGVASAPIDINPDCSDVVACVEAAPTLTLNNVTTDDLTVTGDLSLPASEVAFSTSWNTATLTVWNQTVTAPVVNSNVLSSTWLNLTSTVNWVADSEDITAAVQALIDASTDTVTNTVAGHKIADHTAVDWTTVAINETVTATTAVGTWIQTTNEDGSTNLITFPVINAGTPTAAMEVRVDGNLVTTIPLVQYDVQIDNAGSDFNLVDDQLTFLETNWDSATINFSKYNISATPVTGGIGIYQNWNLITTIPTTASWIAIVDAWNYYTSTNVEWALQELGALVTGWAFTVTDTTTVNLTKTGNDIKADVIIDPATDNLIKDLWNGIFADADAIAHNYDNTTSWLTATTVQDAIDELAIKATQREAIWSSSVSISGSTITLPNTPLSDAQLRLHRNGLRLEPVEDYTMAGNIITLVLAPFPNDKFYITYQY